MILLTICVVVAVLATFIVIDFFENRGEQQGTKT
jgi:hypothetical protein